MALHLKKREVQESYLMFPVLTDKHVGGMEMLIGVVVHSHTGSTLDFADRIAHRLREKGHSVELTQLKTDGEVRPRQEDVRIVNLPDCSRFDAVLVGGPVWVFNASPVIVTCIKSLGGVSGKKLLPFVTQGLPFELMGGTAAIETMRRAAEEVGAIVMPGMIAPKLFRRHTRLKDKLAEQISEWFVD